MHDGGRCGYGGEHAWPHTPSGTHPPGMVNEWTVRILLDCILVFFHFHVVFSKNMPNNWLSPPLVLVTPCGIPDLPL